MTSSRWIEFAALVWIALAPVSVWAETGTSKEVTAVGGTLAGHRYRDPTAAETLRGSTNRRPF